MEKKQNKNTKHRTIHNKIRIYLILIIVAIIVIKILIQKTQSPVEPIGLKGTRYIESSNPVIGFEIKPDSEFRKNYIKTNSLGFSDYEYSFEKDINITRIVVLGDSVTEGFGIKFEESYPKVIEQTFNKDERIVDVINLGTFMYSTIQEVEVLRDKGLKYNPDIVVLGYVLNDPIMIGYAIDNLNEKNNYEHDKAFIEYAGLPSKCKLNIILKKYLPKIFINKNPDNNFYRQIHKNECYWGTVEFSFKELKEMSEKEDFEVIVTIFPLIENYDEYQLEWIHEQVKEEAEKNGFITIDLLNPYKNQVLSLNEEDNVHPNPLGHKIAAEEITKELIKIISK